MRWDRIPDRAYNPFFLVATDGRESWHVAGGPDGSAIRELEPGVHVVGNRAPGDPDAGKIEEIRERVRAIDLDARIEDICAALVRELSSHPHRDRPRDNPCVHTPGYGTRSASVIALGSEVRAYWAADAAPCRAKFHDYSGLLADLARP